jgi:hypothetical protein
MSIEATARVATPELVRQLVSEVREQFAGHTHPEPMVIGARARPQWDHGAITDPAAGRIEVAACATPLAARRAMADFSADAPHDSATLVVLTDLPDAALGADVLGRFVRPRLLALSPWNAVCQRFGVRQLDPAFAESLYSWMAEALLEVPVESVPEGVGMLSVDAGLRAVAESVLGATGVTTERLLTASVRPGFASRVDHADPRILGCLCVTLGELLGPAGQLVAGTIAAGRGERALPAGLAARTLAGGITGSYAQAKVADLTGVDLPTDAALAAWARSSELAFAELVVNDDPVAIDVAIAGSALVTEWQAPFPAASDVLAASFEARLGLLADRLEAMLAATGVVDPTELRLAVQQVVAHREAGTEPGRPRAQRAQLAARLVSWLRDPISGRHGTGTIDHDAPLLLTAAVDAYGADGAWVDAARRRVGEGDDSPPRFAAVLQRISQAAHEQRAAGNLAFAEALARWTTDGTAAELKGSSLVAVEAVLGDVVAPLAAQQPVLLLVLDGCGLAPFLEFCDQFRQFGLQEIGKGGQRRLALAALPTVTEVSRTSLLTGQLRIGAAADESRDLPKNSAVAKLGGPAAVVFHHRPDLISGVGQSLPGPVLAALGANGPRLVAAVVNTIDDELSKGTFTPEYRIEHLGPLHALLRASVDAGRLVVVTADHGHVLGVGLDGKGAVAIAGEGGERWRVADRAATDDEVLLRGHRVLLGDDRGVLAPWHDDLRYSAKHGGYHGGATPDECIVPLSAFAPIGIAPPAGWDPMAVATPSWWDLHIDVVAAEPDEGRATPAKRRRRTEPTKGQAELFADEPKVDAVGDTAAAKDTAGKPSATGPVAPWIDALLGSEVYALQLGAVTRSKPPEDRLRATLGALYARGGVASFAVIAQATDYPLGRVPGFLAIVGRVLNVDGFGVLTVDAQAQEARLDDELLLKQFLGGSGQ